MSTTNTAPKKVPPPQTGQPFAAVGDQVDETTAMANAKFKTISIPHKKQLEIRSRMNVLRLTEIDNRGQGIALEGRRLSQLSQAGKTFVLRSFANEMNSTLNRHGVINKHRVIYIGLKESGTLKMLHKRILGVFGDKYKDIGNADDVEERVMKYMKIFDVELVIIDEAQHLEGNSLDKSKITDGLKALLDTGIVPIVMAGNEDSLNFFTQNDQLAARLGDALELDPVAGSNNEHRIMMKSFCVNLGDAITSKGIFRRHTDFSSPKMIKGLRAASRGHVGRVMRIVGVAVEQAARRNADYVEAFDLANAVDGFAIPKGYCTNNPFLS